MYCVFLGSHLVYSGPEVCFTASNLKPHTQYSFKLRACTEGDESPMSETTTVTTEETGNFRQILLASFLRI